MLEGLVAWVLNNYLGKYVENLNTDQLSIALLSGEVELENLPLKKDAFRNLGLPIEVKAGFIGKVKLQIPVTQVRSKPWVIIIEQLYVVASPLSIQEWDSVMEENTAQERKLSNLDNLEARWRLETNNKECNSTYYASTYSSWLSYGTGLITNIIENLQLKIKDVHIRYEDNVSIPGKAVAFGITVDSLSAQSCNENWVPGFSHWDSSVSSFKLLEMQKLAVYWIDLEYDKLFMKMGLGELAVAMSPAQYNKHSQNYILAPVSAQAKVKRNRSEKPLRSPDTPRIICDLQLEEVPMTLDSYQYNQMVKCVKGLDDIIRFRSYRYYRPMCAVKQDPTAWWLYAISCLYPGKQPQICRPRPTWESCLQHAKENVEYVRIYTKLLMSPNVALTLEDKKLKDQIEWSRTFEELKILRELSMKSVPAQNQPTGANGSAGRNVLVRWFPQWMGWYSSSSSPVSSETTQLEGEILQALSETLEDNTLLRRDVVFGQFTFSLRNGSLNLCTLKENSNERIPMIEFEFKNLCISVTSKPRSSSHTIGLCLGAIYLKDKITLNTTFPVLVGPPGYERTPLIRSRGPSPRVSVASKPEDLFSLVYEKCAANSGCDYRLNVRSKCLDVVYQPTVIKWLVEFIFLPYQRTITHSSIEAMKTRTKKGLIKNWEQMLDGRVSVRKIWDLHLDISAPQIFFVEKFNDPNSYMAVLDFGRFQFSNVPIEKTEFALPKEDSFSKGTDDDELFVTPCSTPPVSEESNSDSPLTAVNVNQQMGDSLTEVNLHVKLYDRYNLELTDMQVLVGKVKDNWRYAHNKGTSAMHVLDRFNISLKIERRVVHTTDPLYPSLTVNANLPKLVAHFNENKITAARTLTQIISATGLPSPFNQIDTCTEDFVSESLDDDESYSVDTSIEMSRLLMLQFSVDHMALEVQSRGRSVAELQVSGVKAAFTKRPVDTSITLTVHSLLLVDALQTFGPDFELLVASHKHVGMDSMSGSLRDSEPTSPTSPGSPDPSLSRPQATSPVALKQALTSLAASPPLHHSFKATYNREPSTLDAEALISIEVILVTGVEPMQLANIQFNNLDIIANQETIVELMGFIRRVFPDMKSHQQPLNLQPTVSSSIVNSTDALDQIDSPKIGTTELTFDFHRLNVLLLRGIVKDGSVQGRKICTATMSEAKIQATVDNGIVVEGSLGGLQVLDLTPEGQVHQRIISVGKDPLLDSTHPLYIMSQNVHEDERKAFSFKFIRNFVSKEINNDDQAEIIVRMASLWYTHSPQFVAELQSCATEFKQYMSNLARSIKSAATDMALGLVNARLSASIYGSALSFSDIASPRRRKRSNSMEQSFSGYSSVRDTIPQTPYSPEETSDYVVNIKLDVVLDTPVLVIPRISNSTQVFVGHLGKITLTNSKPATAQDECFEDTKMETYDIEIKDMNIFSLDTSGRRVPGPLMSRPEILYACDTLAKPILHDTILQLNIIREIYKTPSRAPSLSNMLVDEINTNDNNNEVFKPYESFQINGSVVTALKVSLARYQYEQLIDTVTWLMSMPSVAASHDNTNVMIRPSTTLSGITEEDTGVPTLKMDPHVRAKLFPGVMGTKHQEKNRLQIIKVLFELPNFIVELRGDSPMGEQGLVDLSFRDFCFVYEKCHVYETNIQVSLRSILMEDLLQPEGSKQRAMVISSCDSDLPIGSSCISRSCPNISENLYISNEIRGSLPTNLHPGKLLGGEYKPIIDSCHQNDSLDYPCTPPPSPTRKSRPHKNLVLISTLIVDRKAPNFSTYYNSVERSTSVDFNCLDLVINVESWVLVIDFFSVVPSFSAQSSKTTVKKQHSQDTVDDRNIQYSSETNVSVRSLTVVLVRPDKDLAKANISRVNLSIKSNGLRNEVQGELGSMSLIDLTLHGQLYRERFLTSGKQALNFTYISFGPNEIQDYDAQFKLEMSSVLYVHTKRFVAELIAFFNHFTQLQAVMTGIRVATSGQQTKDETFRLSLIIEAASPVMLLPVSSKSTDLLICNFGQLNINNTFKLSSDVGTISVVVDNPTDKKCLLDVMYFELQNVDLYTGIREKEVNHPITKRSNSSSDTIRLGSCIVRKNGSSILTEPCHFKLQVERNLDSAICHNVPNMSIHGELSTLEGSLNESQYKLIRGFLDYNLGENTEHILPSVQPPPISAEPNIREVWTLNSIRLDLLNVTIRLNNSAPLACINFIKSRLTIETFSNFSQDVDLVSQEILIKDTRFDNVPTDKVSNVFTNILQPLKTSNRRNVVQAEIHSRKRLNRSKSTILLNNMRLMAVFDWWEAARDFIFQNIKDVGQSPIHDTAIMKTSKVEEDINFEFKLNVTDSELVVVEDTSQWDTNAVILKSTTVISYKPTLTEKRMSCNLNNCEMFSCILGMEDETALSIIDPVTLNIEINKEKILEVLLQKLIIRVSYYDMKMFLQILNSLPKQMFSGKKADELLPPGLQRQVDKLTVLGFTTEDCLFALERNNKKIDDAALWLTQNAIPRDSNTKDSETNNQQTFDLAAVEVKADWICLNIIDDCGDADVPLLELSLAHLNLRQCLYNMLHNDSGNASQGALECTLASDYYNRVLSGWEPVVEPWKCLLMWNQSLTSNLSRNRLQMRIESKELLNVNVTSTLIELYKQVRDNWMQDFYSSSKEYNQSFKSQSNSLGYKRRSPFVPFAIKNETGSLLRFTPMTSELDELYEYKSSKKEHKWYNVEHGNTVPFSFKSRGKIRHSDSHKMRMHRLGVQVEGYETVTLVTIDKVGVYFRNAVPSVQSKKQLDLPPARIVFDVALEGSARKLVTVRSAVLVVNKLRDDMELKLESRQRISPGNQWAAGPNFMLKSNSTLSVPLVYAHFSISARPINQIYTFSSQIHWETVCKPGEILYEVRACHTHRGQVYRFCSESKRENYPPDKLVAIAGMAGQYTQPGHTITLLPTVLLVNLLPVDVIFKIAGGNGRVSGGNKAGITFVDTEQDFELKIYLENQQNSTTIRIPFNCVATTFRLKLEDNFRRKLNLTVNVSPHSEAKLKITISAPYWIINKTGLPLVFKQGGVSSEASGQFTEHESARMVAPLLFSFSDPDASPTVVARVGSNVIPDSTSQWCSNFHLQRGCQVRQLKVSLKDGRPDIVFLIGIEVRSGRGKYRNTNIVIISPRFQLHNKTSYQLLFAQSCGKRDVSDPKQSRPFKTYLKAMPDCHMPFHWTHFDQEQMLCVLILDIPDCWWSGGLRIDKTDSMHVNIRDANGRMYFLRLEIVLQGATYFVVFTDADTMPPPLRVDNFSEVSIVFSQTCCKDIVHSLARAHSSVPYAWDKPTKSQMITLEAPGGVMHSYDMKEFGPNRGLSYENFIYIAFSGTFKKSPGNSDLFDVESQELVLDVINKTQVVLARKQQGQRSQLWRMTTTGQLQHEGSSPPSYPQQPKSENVYVLDIEGFAPQPSSYTKLCLRRPDPRRKSTQTWRFTEEGRLCCIHNNMCVQAQDGFYGLRQGSPVACWQQWNAAVLGLPQPVCHRKNEAGVPLEQAVCRQRLRPGSGFLDVEISTDGPTRVISILDKKDKNRKYAMSDEDDWINIVPEERACALKSHDNEDKKKIKEYQFTLKLKGLGVSLISKNPAQELLFANFSNINGETLSTSASKRFCISVEDIQIDNQLFDAPTPIFLHVTKPSSRNTKDAQDSMPALDITAELQPVLNENAVIFKYFIMTLKKLTIHLEERLLLKLFAFIGFNSQEEILYSTDESDYEAQKVLIDLSAAHARRYYFGLIQLQPSQICLSMKTASKLSSQLQSLKKKLGFTFIKFEDAAIDVEPFRREHPFETLQFLTHSIIKHFKDELKWQAAVILGSVDFLGNPLGFMNDVSEGVNGLLREGNVGALVTNLAHGLSNSAAKVTETISDGLGLVAMDDEHEEMRQRIRQVDSGRSRDHLYAGLKGLGFGVLGGATGIFKQVYEGATNEGIQGVFSGIGKGLVGAVAKPVVGVLDLASETARAVRDSSRGSSRKLPDRIRPPRCVFGVGDLLPRYSSKQAMGQQYLHTLNDRNYGEQLVAYENLRLDYDDLHIIISNQRVRIVTNLNGPNLTTIIVCHLSDLEKCRTVSEENKHYIEITMHVQSTNTALVYQDPVKKPRVRCESQELAASVLQQLNYAKRLYDERLHTLQIDNIINCED